MFASQPTETGPAAAFKTQKDKPSVLDHLRSAGSGAPNDFVDGLPTFSDDSLVAMLSQLSMDLAKQETPREDEDNGDLGPAELLEPVVTGTPGSTGAAPPRPSGDAGQQDEAPEGGDPRDREDYPPAPPPSPVGRRTAAGFEEFFRIQPSRLGGLGVFAARELRRGQIILAERPLLRTTHFRLMPDYHNLADAAKRAYLALYGGEGGDRFSRVERIKRLNSFSVPGGIAIFEIASRFNHACASVRNVQYVFDDERGVLSFTICQDVVPAGAELLLNYGGSPVDLYTTYGFRCACGGCEPLTDEDIKRMKDEEYGIFEGW